MVTGMPYYEDDPAPGCFWGCLIALVMWGAIFAAIYFSLR
jgi:hypothetical protein